MEISSTKIKNLFLTKVTTKEFFFFFAICTVNYKIIKSMLYYPKYYFIFVGRYTNKFNNKCEVIVSSY